MQFLENNLFGFNTLVIAYCNVELQIQREAGQSVLKRDITVLSSINDSS